MTSPVLVLCLTMTAFLVYFTGGAYSKPALAKSGFKPHSLEPLVADNGVSLVRTVRQTPAATPSLASILPLLLLLLGEADGGGGAGLGGGGGGGLGGFFGGRGGYSDRRRSGNRNPAAGVAARGKREALRELRTLLDHTAPFSELGRPGASLSPMDQLNKQSFWDSSLRLINDRAWTELAPLLRKMQLAKTFTSANPALDGKVTWSATGGGADCGKPVAPVAPPVFG